MYKFLLFILFLFCFSYANADVYYCTVRLNSGIDVKNNKDAIGFKNWRFKVNIDTSKPSVEGEDIYFHPMYSPICKFSKSPLDRNTMYCTTNAGPTFVFNVKTKQFIYAQLYLSDNQEDTNVLAWGNCEKF